ncbi:unnamed protein product [Lactuca virosa]|uniref:Uncharacterized protein n=1 Tax=Lactuca virosa TaxID=75947 RepID=A0AAU9PTI5_9ASTR|nr:unnamed protein product [Lactuca virosa]
MELLMPHPTRHNHFSWLNHVKEPVYILPNPSISAFSTSEPETWFLPEELHDDDDEMQVDNSNAGSPFEAEDHYDLPIRQLPPPYAQPSGSHFQQQQEYHSYQQHNEPDAEHEFPLDIYSQLASLRLQGIRNTAAIRRIEEQQAAPITTWRICYHFRPEDGYPSWASSTLIPV